MLIYTEREPGNSVAVTGFALLPSIRMVYVTRVVPSFAKVLMAKCGERSVGYPIDIPFEAVNKSPPRSFFNDRYTDCTGKPTHGKTKGKIDFAQPQSVPCFAGRTA